MRRKRRSGILLHPTSLPGPGGIGSLGREARRFVDFLHDAGQSIWQVLPLGHTAWGNSPYMCYSAFAGNPLLIDLRRLEEEGDLKRGDLDESLPHDRVDYGAVRKYKLGVLDKAAAAFFARGDEERTADFGRFCATTPWLHDFALFMALKERHGGGRWCDWPRELSSREPGVMEEVSRSLEGEIRSQQYRQWQFFRQWRELREYARGRGVRIFGDIPLFVAYDSADVWANRELFLLDDDGRPTAVAGVPPDYFSKTGQLWGNPLYNWEAMARRGYSWWIDRVRSSLSLYDLVRLDHFRGFRACWAVPAGEKTAVNGRWTAGPGEALFAALADALGELPMVAEDLGVITPDVEQLRERLGYPGMKILQFAFDSGPDNPYLPHNHVPNSVVYTGTHDNDTTVGWFSSLPARVRKRVLLYLGASGGDIAWELIRAALSSVAETAVVPLQDVLGLPGESRMNLPGSSEGNWAWRFQPGALTRRLSSRLRELTELYGRCVPHQGP